jgi:hypothetical protein
LQAEGAEPDDGAVGAMDRRLQEVKALIYAKIKNVDGYRTWMGSFDTQKGYPRIWIRRSDWNGKLRKWVDKWHPVHRLLCEWEQGEIPTGWTVDHECGLKSCLDHLGACTRPENTRRERERERERGERPVGHPPPTQQLLEAALVPEAPQPTAADSFDIALFVHISRPVFE